MRGAVIDLTAVRREREAMTELRTRLLHAAPPIWRVASAGFWPPYFTLDPARPSFPVPAGTPRSVVSSLDPQCDPPLWLVVRRHASRAAALAWARGHSDALSDDACTCPTCTGGDITETAHGIFSLSSRRPALAASTSHAIIYHGLDAEAALTDCLVLLPSGELLTDAADIRQRLHGTVPGYPADFAQHRK